MTGILHRAHVFHRMLSKKGQRLSPANFLRFYPTTFPGRGVRSSKINQSLGGWGAPLSHPSRRREGCWFQQFRNITKTPGRWRGEILPMGFDHFQNALKTTANGTAQSKWGERMRQRRGATPLRSRSAGRSRQNTHSVA